MYNLSTNYLPVEGGISLTFIPCQFLYGEIMRLGRIKRFIVHYFLINFGPYVFDNIQEVNKLKILWGITLSKKPL